MASKTRFSPLAGVMEVMLGGYRDSVHAQHWDASSVQLPDDAMALPDTAHCALCSPVEKYTAFTSPMPSGDEHVMRDWVYVKMRHTAPATVTDANGASAAVPRFCPTVERAHTSTAVSTQRRQCL